MMANSNLVSVDQSPERVIEVATLKVPYSYVFVLIFERFPVWLLCLEPIWTTLICLPDYMTAQHLVDHLMAKGYPTDLVERAFTRHGSLKLKFSPSDVRHARCINPVSGTEYIWFPLVMFVKSGTEKLSSTGGSR
jgi:hypothetical protein